MPFLAEQMKVLTDEILVSARERADTIAGIKAETEMVLTSTRQFMRQAAADLKQAAKELRDHLTVERIRRVDDSQARLRAYRTHRAEVSRAMRHKLDENRKARQEHVSAHLAACRELLQQFAADLQTAAKTWQTLAQSKRGVLLFGESTAKKNKKNGHVQD
jgi:hypothetical protein